MKKIDTGPVEFYQFDLLSDFPEVTHAVFTRRGGVSPIPFDSLNVSYHTEDDTKLVDKNRETIAAIIGAAHLVSAHQVHKNGVEIIDRLPEGADELQGVDALLTHLPDVALMIKQADCQAIILYDSRRKAIGNVHCGWRGNALDIIGRTVQTMSEAFGSRPQDILACISPSLGPCCAEFKNFREEFPPTLWRYEVKPYHFDLWAVSRAQLLSAGILPEHIEMAGICTKCHREEFFSYRGEKITGRSGTVVALSSDAFSRQRHGPLVIGH
ncbi:MAG: peptidoglycan editing factor PgeF [Thermodesulfobacteriota bacterium]